jgi:hypothetical protein
MVLLSGYHSSPQLVGELMMLSEFTQDLLFTTAKVTFSMTVCRFTFSDRQIILICKHYSAKTCEPISKLQMGT